MKNNSNKNQNIFTKITKVSLVIYSIVVFVATLVFLTVSLTLKNWTFMWGFLLCLGPSILFELASVFLPFEKIATKGSTKGLIALFVIIYILKYCLIFCIPIIGIKNPGHFNKWAMLATTLIAPIETLIIKIIIANKVSKKTKSNDENPKNTIKF